MYRGLSFTLRKRNIYKEKSYKVAALIQKNPPKPPNQTKLRSSLLITSANSQLSYCLHEIRDGVSNRLTAQKELQF